MTNKLRTYWIEVFQMYGRPQTSYEEVRAYTAEDAVTCWKLGPGSYLGDFHGIHCERPKDNA